MATTAARCCWLLRDAAIFCVLTALCLLSVKLTHRANNTLQDEPMLDRSRRAAILEYVQKKLEEALKLDKGTGCELPELDPFAEEVTKFDNELETSKIECVRKDWVKCHHSKCMVVDEIKKSVGNIMCGYKYIMYHSDWKYDIVESANQSEDGSYDLVASDHAKVSCRGIRMSDKKQLKWSGNVIGFRSTVKPKKPPPGREDSLNVLILAFDSTARTAFIRRMPKSWRVLTEELGATVMQGYNIVGDGTPAALFPILTGKTELELPEVRKSAGDRTLDTFPFIFYKLKEDGYRTAYFEDMPQIGTFQDRFNGFRQQPADHYLRAFYLEEVANPWRWRSRHGKYCVGDTPQFKLMMNITEQFMQLDGKRFVFTFIAEITHDDFNMVQYADEDTASFLRAFVRHREDTLLVVMGDHGSRYAKVRGTLQGKLEERLPLMAIVLPESLKRARPGAEAALRENALALTTPHDLHATLLDALGLARHANTYTVRGADLRRGLTMLEPIPRSRSCSEAGIEPHWCACVAWQNVSTADPLYDRAARDLLAYINMLINEVGSKCVPRTLRSTEWVLRQRPNSYLLAFAEAKDKDGYVGAFNADTRITNEQYQTKIVVGPGRGVFEASLTYVLSEDAFLINARDISRTNAYGNEPDCISDVYPHLNFFCYCRR